MNRWTLAHTIYDLLQCEVDELLSLFIIGTHTPYDITMQITLMGYWKICMTCHNGDLSLYTEMFVYCNEN